MHITAKWQNDRSQDRSSRKYNRKNRSINDVRKEMVGKSVGNMMNATTTKSGEIRAGHMLTRSQGKSNINAEDAREDEVEMYSGAGCTAEGVRMEMR